MKKTLLGMALLMGMLPLNTWAEVYKWKDAKGQVRYSDVPPPANVPYETLSSKRSLAPPSAVAKPAPEKTQADRELEARKRQAEAEDAKKKEEARLAEQKLREQNCITAKSNLQNYQQGGRIYRMNEKGEREYLDDAAIAKGIEQAKKDIEEYCKE